MRLASEQARDERAGFVRGLVGEHRIPRDVAGGEHARIRGASVGVDGDEAAIGEGDPGLVEIEAVGEGTAADGDEGLGEGFFALFAGLGVFERDAESGGIVGDAGDAGVQMDGVEKAAQALGEGDDQVAIDAGKESAGHFDDGDARTESGVDGAEFEADVAAAHDEKGFGDFGEREGGGGIPQIWIVGRESSGHRRDGAGGEQERVEIVGLDGAVGRGQEQLRGRGEGGAGLDDAHAPGFGDLGEALRETGGDGFLPLAQFFEADGGRGEFDAEGGGFAGVGKEARGVEEGFGGDAAAVEAGAAEGGGGVDQRDGQAEVGGEEGGGIAGGAGAEDGEGLGRCHRCIR